MLELSGQTFYNKLVQLNSAPRNCYPLLCTKLPLQTLLFFWGGKGFEPGTASYLNASTFKHEICWTVSVGLSLTALSHEKFNVVNSVWPEKNRQMSIKVA